MKFNWLTHLSSNSSKISDGLLFSRVVDIVGCELWQNQSQIKTSNATNPVMTEITLGFDSALLGS